MRCCAVAICFAACASTDRRVDVVVLSGEQGEAAAALVATSPRGDWLASTRVDANGAASLIVPGDAFITAVFPPEEGDTRVVTVAVADSSGDIVIHGPPHPADVPIAGTISVAPTTAPVADWYWILLACTSTSTTTWPMSIEIDAGCVGTDDQVPMILFAMREGIRAEYTAGMVVLDGGQAMFAPTQWHPTTPTIPVQVPENALGVGWTWWIAGLPFGPFDISAGATRWEGLTPQRTSVHASIGTSDEYQQTTRELLEEPDSITFANEDFLGTTTRTATVDGVPGPSQITYGSLRFTWAAADVDADVLDVSLFWQSRFRDTVRWDVVLPPDANGFTTPPFVGEFAELTLSAAPGLTLRYIDGPSHVSFEEVRAAGVFVRDREPAMILDPPVPGQLRESAAYGYRPF